MPSIYDSLSQDSVVANSLWVMMQKEQTIYRSCNYFDQPSLVTESDRKKMVSWCYSVIDNCQFDRDNVAMAMQMVDRLLSKQGHPVRYLNDRTQYQLLTMAALYIAIKFNEQVELRSDSFAAMSCGMWMAKDIEKMELTILTGLEWRIYGPTSSQMAYHILSLILSDVNLEESTWGFILNEVGFQTEYAVRDFYFSTQRPSTTALAAILNALDQVDSQDCQNVLHAFLFVNDNNFATVHDLFVAKERLKHLVDIDVPMEEEVSVSKTSSPANRRSEKSFDEQRTTNNLPMNSPRTVTYCLR
eukprot:CAMPEP_0201920324 /NCGR_PEP_ID=MMETSP0903-20130614/8965_1 /ASSEMBLY_ACC=CAM_ASM_000552 /TAXON_ID=420261 /ORGANISM="Thalassiosira antarctica, Strain CCMP982" /LENGTH=300 /DNA_ID=CAMNT_0048457035 /DNA_START=321 /DNA_END=1223 /DNA_ORIENTATION=+